MIELLKNNNFVLRIIILLGFVLGYLGIWFYQGHPYELKALILFISSLVFLISWDIHIRYIQFNIKIGASLLLIGAIGLLYYLYHSQFQIKSLYIVSAFYLSMVYLNRLEQKNRKSVDQLFLSGVLLSIPLIFYPEYIFVWFFPFILLLVFKIKNIRAWVSPFIAYLFVAIYYTAYLFLNDLPIVFQVDFTQFHFQFDLPWMLLSICNGLFVLYYLLQMVKFGVKERLHAQVHIISSILLYIMCFVMTEFELALVLSLNFYVLPLSIIKQSKYWKMFFYLILMGYLSVCVLMDLGVV